MAVDYLFCAVHAAVTNLNGVSVEDSSEFVILRKVLVYQGVEFASDVGACVLAKRRVDKWLNSMRRNQMWHDTLAL